MRFIEPIGIDDEGAAVVTDGIEQRLKIAGVVYAIGKRFHSEDVDALWDSAPELVCKETRALVDETGEDFFAEMDIAEYLKNTMLSDIFCSEGIFLFREELLYDKNSHHSFD